MFIFDFYHSIVRSFIAPLAASVARGFFVYYVAHINNLFILAQN